MRAAVRVLLLALWLLLCLPPHLLSKLLTGRSGWPRRFLGGSAWICGARVIVEGTPVRPHSLILANHISWLDILVLAGGTGCAFVAKDDLGHGLIHWLADQNGTLYVKRGHRKGAQAQAEEIAAALQRPKPLAIFPEGTVGPGDELLPFRSALLSAVTPPPRDVEVRPVAIDYGAAAREISWHGEHGKDNVLRILGRRGTLPVKLHLLPAVSGHGDRKALARRAREAIADALASSPGAADLYARAK